MELIKKLPPRKNDKGRWVTKTENLRNIKRKLNRR